MIGLILASLFWSPGMPHSRPQNRRPKKKKSRARRPKGYKPPRIILTTIIAERETLRELLHEIEADHCPWRIDLESRLGQSIRGDCNPEYEWGCRILKEPVCYTERGTLNHDQVYSPEDCRIYQIVIDKLGD